MTDHEKTAIRLGKWTPRRECEGHPSAQGTVWCTEKIRHAMHDIPCPALTSDDIFAWRREQGRYVTITTHPRPPYVRVSIIRIDENGWRRIVAEGNGDTELAALENAVAQLPEEKECE